MTPLFESDELRGRAARARELMAEQGLDALLVSGDFSAGANYYYFSGHLPRDYQQNFSRPHLMVLPLDGEPFLYVYGVNVDNARDMSYVVDVVAYAPPFDGVALAGVLRDRGLEAAASCAAIRAGDSEVDASRKVGAALVEAGAYRPPYAQVNLVSHAKSRALGHRSRMLGPIGDYTLEPGDLLFVDSGVVVGAYWGEFNRMAVVGEPSAEQRRHHHAIREIVSRSVDEALRPGAPFRRVIEQMAGFYRDCGYDEEQFSNYPGPPYMHLCHGLGLASSEPPFVRFDSEAVLEPGMVLSCAAYLPADSMT